jgi:hypothetical protein
MNSEWLVVRVIQISALVFAIGLTAFGVRDQPFTTLGVG